MKCGTAGTTLTANPDQGTTDAILMSNIGKVMALLLTDVVSGTTLEVLVELVSLRKRKAAKQTMDIDCAQER
jgi:hypothetical protein